MDWEPCHSVVNSNGDNATDIFRITDFCFFLLGHLPPWQNSWWGWMSNSSSSSAPDDLHAGAAARVGGGFCQKPLSRYLLPRRIGQNHQTQRGQNPGRRTSFHLYHPKDSSTLIIHRRIGIDAYLSKLLFKDFCQSFASVWSTKTKAWPTTVKVLSQYHTRPGRSMLFMQYVPAMLWQ